jgi:hypothetical protein
LAVVKPHAALGLALIVCITSLVSAYISISARGVGLGCVLIRMHDLAILMKGWKRTSHSQQLSGALHKHGITKEPKLPKQ